MVRVHVWTPTGLTIEQQTLLEQLRGDEAFEPRPEDQTRSGKSFFSRVKDVFS